MSLRLRRIALDGFRKFRTPTVIDGLTDGLNIIIEDNEAGKSTLLEALRAAFFVRHNTKNQLAQSYVPHGEAVGPKIEVSFEAGGAPWSVSKRFLRSATVEVVGPQGRATGEDAEVRLNTLLGSVKHNSRGGDVASYGALGLLWVAQTEALAVSAPGQIVRDSVTSTLEAEVGSIMGGSAYKKVRARVEDQYGAYWTPTGQKRGRQTEARERLESAEVAARQAAERLIALEQTFADLENARARLKLIDREIADNTDAETRQALVVSLEVARAAVQILATRRAEQEAASAKVTRLEELQRRHQAAISVRDKAQQALDRARERRKDVAERLEEGRQRLAQARSSLESARDERHSAKAALNAAEQLLTVRRRASASVAARARHTELLALEAEHRSAKATASTAIPANSIEQLEVLERAVAEARAVVNAGATRVALSGPDGVVMADGEPITAGERTLTRPTTFSFGESHLTVTPPSSAESAEEVLAAAKRKMSAALGELGVHDIADARIRNEKARDAAAEIRTLEARIKAGTPVDPAIDLVAGPEALKLYVAGLDDADAPVPGSDPDLLSLTEFLERAEDAFAMAEGIQQSALDALRRIEEEDAPLAAAEAGASSDLGNALQQIEAIEGHPEYPTLERDLAPARQRAAESAVKLEDAERNATAHDPAAITKKIEVIDARSRTAGETRNRLLTDIARLENTIEIEGGAGLAHRAAAAQEEAEAARAAYDRVTVEADTLKLLRETLDEAHDETSAQFVGPVAKRAKRHIERLLPDCELHFAEDLGLVSVSRGGVTEDCEHLSRGTQEQLAVLTRIAFADMLLAQGRPVSLILDDPLVYSDDGRLDLMIEILAEAATRMQVILLTCRDRAFRHVSANRIVLGA
ncbi:AAA family ATPase [Sphingomonas sp.]|uniref:AAA family ATPase n=1 Tax=Sphingomonas sp. TaxID=28214 RepID=UPI003B3A80E4